nr:MAG TPA: Protein of unknown function (DUF3487) [Caudoviricetes sp.]
MTDKVINVVAIMAVIAIAAGILIAIWFGIVGLKVAATGVVVFIAAWILSWWIREEKRNVKTQSRRKEV